MKTDVVLREVVTPDAIIGRIEGLRKSGRGWVGRCPAHEDRAPSLSVRRADDGRVLLHCFAGCRTLDIVEALGVSLSDLFPPRIGAPERRSSPRPRSVLDQARADVLAEARRQPWAREDVGLTYQLADAIRVRRRAVAVARKAATRAGDLEESWNVLAQAAHLELEAAAIEAELDVLA